MAGIRRYRAIMITWILLLRGINVGGNNIIKMQALRELLTHAGYENVRTYIQSGNIAFESANKNAAQICSHVQKIIADSHGFKPKALVLTRRAIANIITNNPFPKAVETPKNLLVYFLATPSANPDMETLNTLKTKNEQFVITEHAAYLNLPDGVWKSKMAARLEKCLGVQATARNWNSVNKILQLAGK